MIPVGAIIGLAIDGFCFSDISYNNITKKYNTDEVMDKTSLVIMINNILITIFAGIMIIFVKNKPENPPSLAALEIPRQKRFLAAFLAAI